MMFKYLSNPGLWERHCSRGHRRHHHTVSSRYNKKWSFRRSRKTCRLCGRSWVSCDPHENYVNMVVFQVTFPRLRAAFHEPSILLERLKERSN